MRRASALVLLLLAAAPAAHANEESQALGARAVIALHNGKTQEAIALLDRAVAADPNDVDALAQRGAARAQLGDYPGAITDLRAALAINPNLPPAALELGVALTETGEYREAEPWLLRAQQQPDLEAQASFFLGLTQLRLERFDDAQRNFERARAGDASLAVSTEYYLGVIAYRRHDVDAAETRFEAVEAARPDSAMGRESTQFLELIRRSRRAAYSVFGTLALEYDSNVNLASVTGQGTDATPEGDGRFVISAGGQYVPVHQGGFSLAVSYEFFQSLQFELTEFNLQDHRPALQLIYDFGPVMVGVLGRYDFYLRQTDAFLQEATFYPWVAVREPGIGRTEVYFRLQRRDYLEDSFDLLNGFYNYAGARQILELGKPERQLWFGYQVGFTDMVDGGNEIFQYGSQQVEIALRMPLLWLVTGEVGYRYEYQGYGGASANVAPVGETRQDNDHRVIVSFERHMPELYEHLYANVSYYGTFNDSNKPDFEYDRNIASVGAEVRF